MSKENNLKDYLTDLYDGISSKKPDASRNPQRFRAEIEAIKTGGIPWDGDYEIEGEPLPEHPKAYYATSVDELPTDAVDGSLAVVECESDIVGIWVFNNELTLDEKLNIYLEFEVETPDNGTQICDHLFYTTTGPGAKTVAFTITQNHITKYIYGYDNPYGFPVGWYDEVYKTMKVIKAPTDEDSFSWVRANATQTEKAVISTLYSRENGKWVKGEEIVGDSAEPNLIEQIFAENGEYLASDEGADGYSKVTVAVPIVEVETELTENRTYTASEFGADGISEFTVNVPAEIPEGLYDETGAWQMVVNTRGCGYLFNSCPALVSVPLFDTSNIESMIFMFQNCMSLTSVPLFDTSNVKNMNSMFQGCTSLTSVPLFDTSNVTTANSMFNSCQELTSVPLFDMSNVTAMNTMFAYCYKLTSVPALDIRKVTNMNNMFVYCQALTDVRLRNIKTDLQVSQGTAYGHLLTVDSLVHLIYELIKQSFTKTLTISTANLVKLANVYVKAIDITDEMRAEDDLIDEKYPFVQCESTDEGAMLITDYATTVKNWTIK